MSRRNHGLVFSTAVNLFLLCLLGAAAVCGARLQDHAETLHVDLQAADAVIEHLEAQVPWYTVRMADMTILDGQSAEVGIVYGMKRFQGPDGHSTNVWMVKTPDGQVGPLLGPEAFGVR